MRISFILSSLWLSGGVRVVVEYANRLSTRGHRIHLIVPAGSLEPDISSEVSPAVNIRQAKVQRPANTRRANTLQMVQLSWALAQATPKSDIVIATHTPTTTAGLLASHILQRGTPIWLYQDYIEMFIDRPFESWLVRNISRRFRRTLTVSNSCKAELDGYSGGDIVVVGEGLSHADVFLPLPLQARQADDNRKNILFLGDMRPRKGLYDFLEAAGRVYESIPEAFLWIVSKEDCQIESRLPFRYIYRPSRSEQARLYATCDLFVSASWWESFGLPPLEAMACGAPVVMTDSRGVREYAVPGENCLMSPPRDPPALAEAMLRVLTSPDLSTRLRQNGPPTAARFTWESAVERFEKAINGLR